MLRQMFHNTLNIVPNGVLIVEIITKKIIFANQEMEAMVGGGE